MLIGALTDALGLSSTLGAFTAGTLLAESNYRTQIEADIKPFRGLLLGLFFLTTGASVEPLVLQQEWPTVLALTAGLIAFKAIITTALGPLFGLSKSESVRTGLLLVEARPRRARPLGGDRTWRARHHRQQRLSQPCHDRAWRVAE